MYAMCQKLANPKATIGGQENTQDSTIQRARLDQVRTTNEEVVNNGSCAQPGCTDTCI